MKKVLFLIAFENFQPREYGEPKRILEENGIEVTTASDKAGMAVSSLDKEKVKVDLVLDEVKVEGYDGVFAIGGPGALEHLDNEKTYAIFRKAEELNKPYGAICISPRILAKSGVLEGKKATGWNGDGKVEEVFSDYGIEYVGEAAVKDGNVITAAGPAAAEEFGKKILEVL